FEENLAIKNAPPIVNYVSNNWGALQSMAVFFLFCYLQVVRFPPQNSAEAKKLGVNQAAS
ncbi:hypothetical protein, partial [Bacillus toyonensis]|uniref:hypothetical protein n=1 Tax=Bacillus toyonensis TaxID=155322 RepID=UPI00256A36EB|nr:hypothetical protein [Bacillus toyonensis]